MEGTQPAPALVPGDIIAIRSGDIVPADVRLLMVTGLEVDHPPMS